MSQNHVISTYSKRKEGNPVDKPVPLEPPLSISVYSNRSRTKPKSPSKKKSKKKNLTYFRTRIKKGKFEFDYLKMN